MENDRVRLHGRHFAGKVLGIIEKRSADGGHRRLNIAES